MNSQEELYIKVELQRAILYEQATNKQKELQDLQKEIEEFEKKNPQLKNPFNENQIYSW